MNLAGRRSASAADTLKKVRFSALAVPLLAIEPVSKPGLYSPVDDGHSLSWTASPSWYTLSASIRGQCVTYLSGSERVSHRRRA